ncbi:hypothetical protein F751_3806 [Auxenochlorella protothecoides]|uniref:Uncharacterized protein n=1 Tax=Auxenochlorella protothecoides TaxID=3075 RepID=A0A087SRE2_AUXPR|nr:hypothetical protein F751_3806 [Auxenochlorella protothecoides]KFM28296.1 hypothetical protein F751_3806 [Auxenochlorella protothecoides]
MRNSPAGIPPACHAAQATPLEANSRTRTHLVCLDGDTHVESLLSRVTTYFSVIPCSIGRRWPHMLCIASCDLLSTIVDMT